DERFLYIYNVQGKAMPCPVLFFVRRGGCSRPLPLGRSPSWLSLSSFFILHSSFFIFHLMKLPELVDVAM
ncbi:MAG: hypothetical protein LBH72_02955, partial [Proteiniphilum sp.]|nr:hypothetical protein [Proteiniphilum sp.]